MRYVRGGTNHGEASKTASGIGYIPFLSNCKKYYFTSHVINPYPVFVLPSENHICTSLVYLSFSGTSVPRSVLALSQFYVSYWRIYLKSKAAFVFSLTYRDCRIFFSFLPSTRISLSCLVLFGAHISSFVGSDFYLGDGVLGLRRAPIIQRQITVPSLSTISTHLFMSYKKCSPCRVFSGRGWKHFKY